MLCSNALAEKALLHLDMVEQEASKSAQVVMMNEREVANYEKESKQIGV